MKDGDDDNLINVIVDVYNKKKVYKLNEKNVSKRKISLHEIIQTMRTLQLYEKQIDQKNQNFIACLKKYDQFIDICTKLKQAIITILETIERF